MTDDQHILDLLKGSNTQNAGFSALMHKYQERLYWHIRRIVLTHEDADDVFQNSMIKVFRSAAKFRGDASLYTWLYRICTNEALTHLKKAKQHQAEEVSEFVANRLKNDPYFDGDKVQVALKQAVTALPEKQMLVFNMKYYQNMKYEDISQILGTSVGGLKASYHHAVKKIESHIVHHHES